MNATDVIRRGAEAFNAHDVGGFAAVYAPNATVTDPMYPQPLEGRDAVRDDIQSFMTAFPDIRITLHTVIGSGEDWAYRGTMEGTHLGPLPAETGEIPPTGRVVRFHGAAIGRVDGQGRIVEEYRYYDFAALLAQLGVEALSR